MGVVKCAANGCKSSIRDCSKAFHSFPASAKDPERFAVWVKFSNNGAAWTPTFTKNRCQAGLCSDHFEPSCYYGERRQKLKSDAIPTLVGNSKAFLSREDGMLQAETKQTGDPDVPTDSENMENIRFTSLQENVCEACQPLSEEPCWVHGERYTDEYVPVLAVASLPEQLYLSLRHNKRHDQAVFAKDHLERGSIFGPLMAPLSDKYQSPLPYGVCNEATRKLQYFQLECDRFANWMKYVRTAENSMEQNLAVHSFDGGVFFVTTKLILPGQELRVGYSRRYAQFMSGCIDSTLPDENGTVGLVLPQDSDFIQFLNGVLQQRTPQAVQQTVPSEPLMQWYQNRQTNVSENKHLVSLITARMPSSDAIPAGGDAVPVVADLGADEGGFDAPKPVRNRKKRRVTLDGSDPPKRGRPRKEAEMMIDNESGALKSIVPSVVVDRSEATPKARCKKRKVNKYQTATCEVCGVHWTRLKYLQEHLRKAHPDYCPDWQECSECPKRFPSRHSMVVHSHSQHRPEPMTVTPAAVEEAIAHMKATATFSYYCTTCLRHYPGKKIYDLHQLHHIETDITGYSERDCPVCEYHAPNFPALVAHTLEHGRKPKDLKPCLICGKYFKGLKFHVRQDHPDVVHRIETDWEFQCEECEIKFKLKRNLDLHVKTVHKGFQCLYCAKVYCNSKEMGQHVMEHKKADAYPCPICDKTFPIYPFLNNHYRTHHDVTKIKTCPHCLKVSSFGNQYFSKHVLRCAAGKPPPRKKRHGQAVKGPKPFDSTRRVACDECSQLFVDNYTRWKHVRVIHRGDTELQEKCRKQKEERRNKMGCAYVGPRKRLALAEFPHQCAECQMGFITEVGLYKHNESRHPEKSAGTKVSDTVFRLP